MLPLRRLLAGLGLTITLLATTAGCTLTSTGSDPTSTGIPAAGTAPAQLAALKVAPAGSMSGYSRDRFPHWRQLTGGCDTRDVVLKSQGRDVVADANCTITKGTWHSPYDDKTFTDPSDLDIDHVVPLANAWRSGASAWTDQVRGDFANDIVRPQLLAVSASQNRSKGDQDPSTWKPANRNFWCEYAKRWITVKTFYKLTITSAERTALDDMLATCSGAAAQPSAPGAGQAPAQLAALKVAAARPMTGYSRDRFPHWRQLTGGCDTRDVVLKSQGRDVVADANCTITKGTWVSPYDAKTFTDPSDLDIDHVVPLADAWRSGADSWTDQVRGDFANDIVRPQLLAVSASQNRSKGDQDPSTWKPADHAYWCEYARRWITVKTFYKLTVTGAEKAALTDMLATCSGSS